MDHRRDEYSTIGLLWRAADRIAARWSRLHERQPVVRKSSQYDEFAMSQAGLKYLLAALQAGKIDDGYVVLIAWNGRKLTVVHTMTSPLCPCAVERRRFPVGANPTRQPLQPEATGAAMEVTKWLKPSECVSRIR